MIDESGVYQLSGSERKEETTEQVDCGDIVTTTYYLNDEIVRVDKAVNVSAAFMAQAFSKL